MNTTGKSIKAGVIGILVGIVLSIGTDKILESVGILPKGNLWVGVGLICFVLLYRVIYNIIGSYIVAKLAPSNPMKHALIVGTLGAVVSAVGAVATADMNLGPAWYAWTLTVLMIPSSWLGAKIYQKRNV